MVIAQSLRAALPAFAVGTTLVAALVGLPAAARADTPAPVTVVAERGGTTNSVRAQGVDGVTVTVARGTSSYSGTTVPTLYFASTVGGQAGTLQAVTLSADLGPGTYATTRLPGQGAALLDPGSISACGGAEPGTLTVTEASYTDAGVPSVFAASFDVAACDAEPPVHGEIRWNSTTPLALATAPTSVAITPPVAAKSSADLPVTVTAVGNAPVTLGAPAVQEKPQSDGTTFWSIAADTCSGAVLSTGQSCTVTLRFSPGYPNGVPNGPQSAWLTIGDGQATPVSVYASATIAPLPGQPRGLDIDAAFRHLVLHWGVPSSFPDGWTQFGATVWNVYRQVPGPARELVGSAPGTSLGPTSFVLASLPRGYAGTFTVQGVQNGIAGAESAPVAARVADRELLYATDYSSLQNQQLAPVAGTTHGYQGLTLSPGTIPQYDLTVSANQSVMAFDVRDNGDPQSATVGVATLDGGATGFADVSGGDGSGVHWDVDPALSPDGSLIAYAHGASSTDTATVLRIASLRTAGTVRAVPGSTGLTDPAFTADGRALVAVQHTVTGTSLVRIDPATGARTTLAGTGQLAEPAVAPDGRLAAVRRYADGSARIVVLPPGSSTPQVLATVPAGANWHPSWTRDGLITFVHRDALSPVGQEVFGNAMAVDPATGTVTALTQFDLGGAQAPQVLVEDRPDVTAPKPALAVAQSPAVTGATASLRWSATDPVVPLAATSGVAAYDVRYRTATATRGWSGYLYPAAWKATTATHGSVSLAPGTEYCFSVRARDRAGNVSPWTADRCVARAADDRVLSATAAVRGRSTRYFAQTYTRTAAAGALLQLGGVTATRVGIVVTTCSHCGSIDVSLAGHYLGRISTYATTTHYQQVRWLPAVALRTGTLRIRAAGATSDFVDGVVTVR